MRGFRTLTFWYLLLVDPNPPNPCWGCLNFVTWKCEQIQQKCNNCCCYCCCCQLMFISNNKINYLTGHFIHEHVCTLSTRYPVLIPPHQHRFQSVHHDSSETENTTNCARRGWAAGECVSEWVSKFAHLVWPFIIIVTQICTFTFFLWLWWNGLPANQRPYSGWHFSPNQCSAPDSSEIINHA